MRLYSGSSEQFIKDSTQNKIASKLENSFLDHFHYEPSPSEIRSWNNSLRALKDVFVSSGLTNNGVLLEYQLPLTSKRLDCMVTGYDDAKESKAVIIELKQWEECDRAPGENEVKTWVGGNYREVLHPSAQVGQYSRYLKDTHTAFYEGNDPIELDSCSYLHNYRIRDDDELLSPKFSTIIEKHPVFSAEEVDSISNYLSDRLIYGDGLEVLKRVEKSKYRPSKKLMDHVGNVIKGKDEYVLLDEQLVVYDKIMSIVKKGFHEGKKRVVIIKGGPGTGKSVIALNLMADLSLKGYNSQYATGSRAFTTTLRDIIGSRGAVQFKYFNSYMDAERNEVDVLICDEAHRIREFSHNRFTKKENRTNCPQVEELIHASKVCVFFIDDHQVVRPNEIGSVNYIKKHAERLGCDIYEHELEVQFRCAGSEAFVNWINNTLNIKKTANVLWDSDEDFDFRIFPDPFSLEEAIREKEEEGHTARMTAGFCWPWSKEANPDGSLVKDVVIGDYKRPWNANPKATGLASDIPKSNLWASDPNGIDQVGCVYTAQGFEFDYVGVIFGLDLVYDFDKQQWVGNKDESEDYVVKRSKDQFLDLVKNTYRVLLSRGMKGCYVYFMDKDTERFFKSRIE